MKRTATPPRSRADVFGAAIAEAPQLGDSFAQQVEGLAALAAREGRTEVFTRVVEVARAKGTTSPACQALLWAYVAFTGAVGRDRETWAAAAKRARAVLADFAASCHLDAYEQFAFASRCEHVPAA